MKQILVLLVLGILLFGCTQNGTPPTTQTPTTTVPSTPTTSGQTTPAGQTLTIRISNFAFNPAQLTVKEGDTVIWVNDDSAPHTIKGSGFESGTLSKGQSYERKFIETAGEYAYICGIHPSMKGTIIVTIVPRK